MKAKNNSVSYFDMQFITSSISTTLVLLLLGLVVFFVLAAHNLSVYVKENISFSVLVSDDMKEGDILKLQKRLDKEAFVKQTEYISRSRHSASRLRRWVRTRKRVPRLQSFHCLHRNQAAFRLCQFGQHRQNRETD